MSSLVTAASTEMLTISKSALGFDPSVNKQYRSTNARIDWRKLVAAMEIATMRGETVDPSTTITPPFTVLDFGKWVHNLDRSPIGGALYDVPYTLYYIEKEQDKKLSEMEDAAQAFVDAMLPGGNFTNFAVYPEVGTPVMDSSPDNAANKIFLSGGYQLLCVAISGMITVGELYPGLNYG